MNYHNLTYPDQNNGDGLRVVLWLSGCSHHCYKCQNPQTWDTKNGILFDEGAKKELFEELNKDYISGLTLSGGDPLHEKNLDGVLNLVNEIRVLFPKKTIWLYTGYTWEECNILMKGIDEYCMTYNQNNKKRQQIISLCDVLIDGRYIDSKRDVSLKWRGSSNQRVINIRQSLEQNKIVLYCD